MAFVFTPEGTQDKGESMFKAEQQVKYRGMAMPATIISGPHKSPGTHRYLIKKADGFVSLTPEGDLTALDDRREKVADIIYRTSPGFFTRPKCERMAEQILAAVDKPRPLAVGDRIRILQDGLQFAIVSIGDVLTVSEVDGIAFHVTRPTGVTGRMRGYWVFALSGEGVGWERA